MIALSLWKISNYGTHKVGLWSPTYWRNYAFDPIWWERGSPTWCSPPRV